MFVCVCVFKVFKVVKYSHISVYARLVGRVHWSVIFPKAVTYQAGHFEPLDAQSHIPTYLPYENMIDVVPLLPIISP